MAFELFVKQDELEIVWVTWWAWMLLEIWLVIHWVHAGNTVLEDSTSTLRDIGSMLARQSKGIGESLFSHSLGTRGIHPLVQVHILSYLIVFLNKRRNCQS